MHWIRSRRTFIVILMLVVWSWYGYFTWQEHKLRMMVGELHTELAEKHILVEELLHQLHESNNLNSELLSELTDTRGELGKLSEDLRIAAMTDVGEWQTYKATFYSNGVASTGKLPGDKGYGITKSGRRTELGITAAVDPRVIPLGSWFAVKFPDGSIEVYRADDTGSGVKGQHIDLFTADDTIARKLGTFPIEVKILE